MKKNLLSLDAMLGGPWQYQGAVYQFLASKKEDETIVLVTNKKWFYFKSQFELDCFLADCRPVQDVEPAPRNNSIELSLPDTSSDDVMARLKGVLMDNIAKVSDDKSYVPQAQMVSKTVQTLVNLTKLELQIKAQAER